MLAVHSVEQVAIVCRGDVGEASGLAKSFPAAGGKTDCRIGLETATNRPSALPQAGHWNGRFTLVSARYPSPATRPPRRLA